MSVSQLISQKFHDFSMSFQLLLNSMIFPCMEFLFVIFQVFHDFQSLWEPCQGQLMVIIYVNFVELESPIIHAKFQENRTSGSGEEDF